MKILFLYPSADSQLGFNYGVAQLAGLLEAAGHRVGFWQLCEELEPLPSREEFAARLRQEAPDVLAFSVVTNQWAYARQLARWAREVLDVPLVLGGVHALVATEEILGTGLFDYVFRGESEEAFPEFVGRLERGESVEDVANVAFRGADGVRINPVRPLPELEGLADKDYSVMDFQRLIDAKNGWVGLMASRGCPFACSYCFNHKMVAAYREDLGCSFKELNYIRRFSVEQVIDEIKYLLANYRNISMFIFDDDLFTFDRDYVRRFCEAYRRTTDLPFVVNAHFGFFDRETAQCLAEANCRIVKFGIESGSVGIRDRVLNRHMSNESIIETLGMCGAVGLHSSCFVIIGLPYETVDDLWATVRLLADSRPGRFRWTYFFPYPGTVAHELAVEGEFLDEGKMKALSNFTDQSCLDFGPEHNLLLRKIGHALPWFVNACSGLPVAEQYRQLTDELLALDAEGFAERAGQIRREDAELSARLSEQGLTHYAIKYNRFMGVISDYFLHEA